MPTVAICDECWNKHEPNRQAVRVTEPVLEQCCGCGNKTMSGIYVRQWPPARPH